MILPGARISWFGSEISSLTVSIRSFGGEKGRLIARIRLFGGEKRKPKKKIKKKVKRKVKNLKIPLTYNHYCSILNATVVII